METITGGCTLWARQTIESEIFFYKPDKWFKIWFYLVNTVNHKDTKLFKRGEGLITYEDIIYKTKATKKQIEKCLKWLKREGMLGEQKTTRGNIKIVLKYGIFQNMKTYEGVHKEVDGGNGRRTEGGVDKQECKNDKNNNIDDFSIFWNLYDKKVGQTKCKTKWNKLSAKDKQAILDVLPAYKNAKPDKQFRKNPETFLNNRSWEDEIVQPSQPPKPLSDFEIIQAMKKMQDIRDAGGAYNADEFNKLKSIVC